MISFLISGYLQYCLSAWFTWERFDQFKFNAREKRVAKNSLWTKISSKTSISHHRQKRFRNSWEFYFLFLNEETKKVEHCKTKALGPFQFIEHPPHQWMNTQCWSSSHPPPPPPIPLPPHTHTYTSAMFRCVCKKSQVLYKRVKPPVISANRHKVGLSQRRVLFEKIVY